MNLNRPPLSIADIVPRSELASFQQRIDAVLDRSGLSIPTIAKRHGELIQGEDSAVAMRGIELAYKLHGFQGEAQVQQLGDTNIQVNIVQVTNNDSLSSTQG